METTWRGLQAPGKQAEKDKWPFLINNGRTNVVWQNAYLDQNNEFVMDRMPYPLIQMSPQDMADIKVNAGDLVEVYNDNGSTQAMVYPTTTARRKETFMLFANPNGVQGNVVSPGVNELIIPNYKQTWAAIRNPMLRKTRDSLALSLWNMRWTRRRWVPLQRSRTQINDAVEKADLAVFVDLRFGSAVLHHVVYQRTVPF